MAQSDDASPICRGKNLSWETILLFYNNMPRVPMPKAQFNTYTESRINAWTQTHSQIARQLALYYEKDGICYPRFTKEISYTELFAYMQNWATKYFVPNPYAPSLKDHEPTCIYAAVIKAIKNGETDIDTILDSIFGTKISSHDKVIVYLSNFTNLIIDNNKHVSINNRTIEFDSKIYPDIVDATDSKNFFDYFGNIIENRKSSDITKYRSCIIKNQPKVKFLTALRTKPFILLAGISGTGKSRIVREMAKACWKEGNPEYGKNHPRNFCMVQVKPNWHDSSELIGYVSRLNGEKFVVGPFLRFLAAALKEPEVPYFLCLDEMNLAPVEQYFAEYLSVIESRKLNPDGTITTDPIIEYENTDAYGSLIDQLFDTPEERKAYKTEDGGKRLTIPQNLFVVGTVNMDETTFSFSRKVLDRAITIEMNEVDLHGGLERGAGNEIGYIGNSIIGDAAEGCDIYEDNRDLCDQVLAYLEQVNAILEGTPFKIAYRTRNEFLMYAVNRKALAPDSQLWQTLDEMTSMKILSRIEGDEERTKKVLDGLKTLVEEQIVSAIPPAEEGKPAPQSISAAKIEEMQKKLQSTGFTSYWA